MTDNASLSQRARLWHRLRVRFGGSGLVLLGVLLAMAIGCVVYAVEGEKPWSRTVQRRFAKQGELRPPEYAIIGTWWAAVLNAGALALLIGTAGKWMPRRGATPSDADLPPETREDGDAGMDTNGAAPKETAAAHASRTGEAPDFLRGRLRVVTFILLAGAVLLGAWERWPKMQQSFWNDEEYAVRRFSHGAWEQQKQNGAWKFEPVTWVDTLFESRNGNNHVLNSLTMRVALDVWRAITGAARESFAEVPVRLPSYIAALITIFLVFMLGKELGSPLAGLAGAWLLALHPWHIRYSAEARGYSMMLCFLSLSLYGLLCALRTNRLRWWLVFGLAEAAYLLSFAGSLHVAAMVNLFALIELIRQRRWAKVRTLIAMNLLGATLVLQLMLPNIPQLLIFLKEPLDSYVTSVWQWYRDLGCVLVVGWPYENPFPDLHHGTDWLRERQGLFFSTAVTPIVLLLLAGASLLAATVRSAGSRMVIVAPVLAAVITCAMNVRPGTPMTVWYLIYLLIPVVLAVPMLIEDAARLVTWRWTGAVLVAWLVLRFDSATDHARAVVRGVDRQPVRQTVALIRSQSPEAVTATFGVSDRQSAIYDPRVRILQSTADLDRAISESHAAATALYVYYCSDQHSARRVPDVYARVVHSGEFERVGELPGSEELFSYRVYRRREGTPATRAGTGGAGE